MDRKSALAAATLALAAGAVSAQTINFTPTGAFAFERTFDPDGGVFTMNQFISGETGNFSAGSDGTFSLTYLGQESLFDNGVRISINGGALTELNSVGDFVTGPMVTGQDLDFTFFASDGTSVANGANGGDSDHPSFMLLGRDVATNRGTFAYVLGYNDGADHDDWDDFVVGLNPTAPIPEPQTYALLLAGLGVVGFVARRRQAR